ncbi:uncharacterized protein LOC128736131 [Sabethes cyaneus]|uniref:uncharacterized protein LOC128736131 n=1 Tax=Sabethes cyaneus TaxID=53552 RepID=UPI00237DF30B|nr:uncharacterized protein LOC128736131 [Sabethes cyaneus]
MIKIIPLLVVSLLVAITAAIDNPHHAASKYQYQYQYGVNDGQTGDHKSHWEHRDGDHVEGQYTVADADGTHRVVQYKADPTVGFQFQCPSRPPQPIDGGVGYELIASDRATRAATEIDISSSTAFVLVHCHSDNINRRRSKMLKIVTLVACLAIAVSAEYYLGEHVEHEEYHSHPKYKFEYGVKDPHTGDHKSQWEHRDGDVVVGSYTLDEADGTHRVVSYNSDDHNGFQAHVQRVGHAHHPHGESYANIDQHH